MPSITIKNIPDDLYQELKQHAKANRRSINSEVIVCIERTVSSRRIEPSEILADARRLRELTKNHPITDREFNEAKRSGRI